MAADLNAKLARMAAEARMLEEVFNLEEGPVTLTFPAELSQDSYEDLEAHFALLLRKAKRRAGKLSDLAIILEAGAKP